MMNLRRLMIAVIAVSLAGPALAAPAATPKFTAVLHQRIAYWQLVTPDGPPLQVTTARSSCRPGRALPRGEWSVARDADGRTELRPNFAGAPTSVRLVPCGDETDGEPSVQVPAALIDWIAGGADRVVIE